MLAQLWDWILIAVLSALFNITPILAPPTMAMLAYFQTQREIGIIAAVVIGALGSTAGRLILARVSRRIGPRMVPAKRRADLEDAVRMIQERKRLSVPMLALFAVGPIPKAYLFMAAGIAKAPLWPGAVVFCVARAGIYASALIAVDVTYTSFGDILFSSAGGPLIIAAQLASVVGFFLLLRMDIRTRVRRVATAVRSLRMRFAVKRVG